MNIRLYLFGVCARVCVFVRASVKNRVNLHSIASSGLGEGYRLSGQNNDVSLSKSKLSLLNVHKCVVL